MRNISRYKKEKNKLKTCVNVPINLICLESACKDYIVSSVYIKMFTFHVQLEKKYTKETDQRLYRFWSDLHNVSPT